MKKYPSQERLKELFDYHPDGYLVWKCGKKTGLEAGCASIGKDLSVKRLVWIDYKTYPVARIIWIFHKGCIADGHSIFHMDGNISNNKIENLYSSESKKAKKSHYQRYSRSNSGYIGVYKKGDLWCARAGKLSIGCYTNKEAAAAAYNNAVISVHGNMASLNDVVCEEYDKYRHTRSDSLIDRHKKNGFTGVVKKGGGYSVFAFNRFIGTFSTEIAAAAAYNFEYENKWGVKGPNKVGDIDFESFRTKKVLGMGAAKSSSGFKGVNLVSRKSGVAYSVRITIDGKYKTIGTFYDIYEAARAYNIAAYEHYGENAVLNDIPDPLGRGDVF